MRDEAIKAVTSIGLALQEQIDHGLLPPASKLPAERKLSIYVFNDEFEPNFPPLMALCNPGRKASELIGNPRRAYGGLMPPIEPTDYHVIDVVRQYDPMADFPDRLDALVWALTALMLDGAGEPRVRGV